MNYKYYCVYLANCTANMTFVNTSKAGIIYDVHYSYYYYYYYHYL